MMSRLSTRQVSHLLLALDSLLCIAIVLRISYTEIDWIAYMQQVESFLNGEREYTKIEGNTGPLVYPAGHLYIFTALHWITSSGKDILTAQAIFAGLYLSTTAITMATYRKVKAPLYIFPFLILSKRLHSIYMLRLFNDGVSTLLMSLSTHNYVNNNYSLGSLFFTLSVSVKMNSLLYLPAIGLILIQGRGVAKALQNLAIMVQVQILLGGPFLLSNAAAYLNRAFEFSRVFMYKWTVNWRFVPEEVFLSKGFSMLLLTAHLFTLLVFAATRWNRPSRKSLSRLITTTIRTVMGILFPMGDDGPMAEMQPSFVLITLYTSNLIGILFARSAHYQFYSWFAFTIPYMLYKTGLPLPIQLCLWLSQEWAWNVYPSTSYSSGVVVGVPIVMLVAIWANTKTDVVGIVRKEGKSSRKRV